MVVKQNKLWETISVSYHEALTCESMWVWPSWSPPSAVSVSVGGILAAHHLVGYFFFVRADSFCSQLV